MITNQAAQPNRKTSDFRMKYKTEKCRYWTETGSCPFSNICAFAHFDEEIRSRKHLTSNYRTKLCINFMQRGFCTYGTRCLYVHQSPASDCASSRAKADNNRSSSKDSERTDCSRSLRDTSNQLRNRKVSLKLDRHDLLLNFGLQLLQIRSGSSSRLLKQLNAPMQDSHSLSEEYQMIWQQHDKKDKKHSL